MRKPITRLLSTLVLVLFGWSVILPAPSHAALVGAGEILSENPAQARDQLSGALKRQDVRDALIAQGVDPQVVDRRIAALTDAELTALAQRMDEMPAGADALGAVVLVFIILLITDILGYTDLFPFVKKAPR